MTSKIKIFLFCAGLVLIVHASSVASCPTIVSRDDWGAEPTTLQYLDVNPAPLVFIHHTAGEGCTDRDMCSAKVKSIQEEHINLNNWADIGYSFLIGGDGAAYEGRGWGKQGAQAYGFSGQSISIALIGDFTQDSPPTNMLDAAKDLIACGVESGYISPAYILYGHRQAIDTESPGEMLYKTIRLWTNWSPEWIYNNDKCKAKDGKCMDKIAHCDGDYEQGLCPGPSDVQCCVPCQVTPLDIQFLLDESGSITLPNFLTVKKFVRDFADSFQIGPEKIQFGVATFSSRVANHFWLNSFTDKSSALKAVDDIDYSEGGTSTHLALDFAREEAFTPEHGDRPNITNVLIVITDGLSNFPNDTKIAAEELHKTDILVLSVGVGQNYSDAELALIATDETTVFHVENFIALKSISDDLRKKLCKGDIKQEDFPEWAIITLSVGGSVVVLGFIAGITGILVVKAKAAAGAAGATAAAGGP